MSGISSSLEHGFPKSPGSTALAEIGFSVPRNSSLGTPLARMSSVNESRSISLPTQAQDLDSMGEGWWGGGDGRSLTDQDGKGVREWRSIEIGDEWQKKRRSPKRLRIERACCGGDFDRVVSRV